jgi:predicted GNAT superfamily acetyltransferase
MLRDATPSDFAAILALNTESEHFLSPLSLAGLADLHRQARYHRVACADGQLVAFLLVLAAGAEYQSLNYQWFAKRYDRFFYIDRIVVARAWQGMRHGSALYQELIVLARKTGTPTLTCEFDVVPLNERSQRFHQRFGFREVGLQWVAGGKKQVSLQALELDAGQTPPRLPPPARY